MRGPSARVVPVEELNVYGYSDQLARWKFQRGRSLDPNVSKFFFIKSPFRTRYVRVQQRSVAFWKGLRYARNVLRDLCLFRATGTAQRLVDVNFSPKSNRSLRSLDERIPRLIRSRDRWRDHSVNQSAQILK